MRVALRRGKAADWLTANPILAPGEPGYETDTHLLKVGDGVTVWSDLTYTVMDYRLLLSNSKVFIQNTPPVNPPKGSFYINAAGGSFATNPPPPTPPNYSGTLTLTSTGTLACLVPNTRAGSVALTATGTLTAAGHI